MSIIMITPDRMASIARTYDCLRTQTIRDGHEEALASDSTVRLATP
jgi:hypothetical protein